MKPSLPIRKMTRRKLTLRTIHKIGMKPINWAINRGLAENRFAVVAIFGGYGSGKSILANEITGSGSLVKAGKGDLSLTRDVSFNGQWIVEEGRLLLKQDSHLGAGELVPDGGAIAFEKEFKDLRAIVIEEQGGTIDNNSFNVDVQFKEWDSIVS